MEYFKAFFENGKKSKNQCARELKLTHLQHRKVYQIIDQYERLSGKQRYKIRDKDKQYANEGKRWTKNQLKYLKDSFEDGDSIEMMVEVLERSPGGILSKARSLGYTQSNKTSERWSKEDEIFVIQNINRPSKELAEVLGRTVSSIDHKKDRLRNEILVKKEIERIRENKSINYKDNWTKVEEDLLWEYMDYGIYKLLEVLPHRTEQEIREKVHKLCYEIGCPNPLIMLS